MDYQVQPTVVTATPTGFTAKLIGAVHTNTASIEGEFRRMMEAKPRAVELDLSETSFLSSTGIALLIWLYNGIVLEGGSMRVVAIRKRVLTTLKVARLDGLLGAASATVLPD